MGNNYKKDVVLNIATRADYDAINAWLLQYADYKPLDDTENTFYKTVQVIRTMPVATQLVFITWILCDYKMEAVAEKFQITKPAVYKHICKVKEAVKSQVPLIMND